MSGWISVKDRLPEENDFECIIAFYNSGSGPFSSAARWRDGGWWEENNDDGDEVSYSHLRVTHWQPLPAPPEGA